MAARAWINEHQWARVAAVLAASSSWIDPPPYDKELYKARAEVECTFNLLKQARRFATRYEKTLLWLRI